MDFLPVFMIAAKRCATDRVSYAAIENTAFITVASMRTGIQKVSLEDRAPADVTV